MKRPPAEPGRDQVPRGTANVRTVAIINQKGGCGKTTTAVNLAGALAALGRPTLLVDLDPQSHCAAALSVPETNVDLSSADLFLAGGDQPLDETRLLWSVAKHLEVAPSTVALAGLEAARGGLADKADRDQRLADALDRFSDRFEFCILDCPPSIGLLTFSALRAASETIIPVETAFFSMHGAQRQVQTLRSLARRLGGPVPYSVLPTMHNPESSMARDVLAELRRAFKDRVIPTPIRLDARVREAASFGQSVIEHSPSSWGAEDYLALARWLEERTAAGPATFDADPEIVIRATAPRAPAAKRVSANDAEAARAARQQALARNDAEAAPAPQPRSTDRARDLADRARKLLSRTGEIQDRINKARGVHLAPDVQPQEPPVRAAKRPTDLYGVRETAQGALFVHPAARDARVAIAADFNAWSPADHQLAFNESLGVHQLCVPLPPGDYEYRLVVDGAWIADPFNPSTSANPFGGTNSRFSLRGVPARELQTAEGSD